MQLVLADGITILGVYKEEIALLLLVAFSLGGAIAKSISISQLDGAIRFLFKICTGVAVLCSLTFILALIINFKKILFQPLSFLIVIFSFFFLLREGFTHKFNIQNVMTLFSSLLILLFLFLLHLPLLNHIILPGYSDSPIHYQIIDQVINPYKEVSTNLSISSVFENYYHFGFHSLTAWLSSISGLNPLKAISLIGQISLVLAPISIICLTFILTKNNVGALSAGFLATLGWSMPAFAINWGKFPALLSLALIPTVVGYAILLFESKEQNSKRLLWLLFLIISVSIVHTRAVIILVLTFASIYLATIFKYREQPDYFFSIRVSALYILLLFPLHEYIMNYYYRYSVGLILIVLLPFAFRYYPKEITGLFFYTSGLWMLQFLAEIFSSGSFEFLDSQFISMMLFIPFSIIGGLGIAGVTRQFILIPRVLVILIFVITVTYHSPWRFSTLPDPCCNYYSQDDKSAFQWIEKSTQADSLFLISTFSDGKQQYGTDAGIWIQPLTGRDTNKILYSTNWNDDLVFPDECNSSAKEIYIYTGGREYSFSNKTLLSMKWLELAYASGSIKIYKILQCISD